MRLPAPAEQYQVRRNCPTLAPELVITSAAVLLPGCINQQAVMYWLSPGHRVTLRLQLAARKLGCPCQVRPYTTGRATHPESEHLDHWSAAMNEHCLVSATLLELYGSATLRIMRGAHGHGLGATRICMAHIVTAWTPPGNAAQAYPLSLVT
jgi:hypothetical protein